jgi:hypothetical protein
MAQCSKIQIHHEAQLPKHALHEPRKKKGIVVSFVTDTAVGLVSYKLKRRVAAPSMLIPI